MTRSDSALTKTCNSCGLQKPLSAFLQIAGPEGATYTNICADCRKQGLDKQEEIQEHDDFQTSETGHRIDSKSKFAKDIDEKELRTQIEEQYHKERDENEIEQSLQGEKIDNKIRDERKHRESFLKNRSFLSADKKIESKPAMQARQNIERATRETQANEETIKQDQALRDEQQIKGIDTTAPMVDTQIAGKEKFKGDSFKRFATLIGNNSPLGRTFAHTIKNAQQQGKDLTKNADKQSLSEHIENKWGPSSGRKR